MTDVLDRVAHLLYESLQGTEDRYRRVHEVPADDDEFLDRVVDRWDGLLGRRVDAHAVDGNVAVEDDAAVGRTSAGGVDYSNRSTLRSSLSGEVGVLVGVDERLQVAQLSLSALERLVTLERGGDAGCRRPNVSKLTVKLGQNPARSAPKG